MALKVVPATGLQGFTYNPQQTAPTKTFQNTVPASVIQPAAPIRVVQPAAGIRRFQPAYRAVPRVPSPAEVQAAAAQAAAKAAAEAARLREILRQQVQLKVDNTVAAKRSQVKLAVTPAKQRAIFAGLRPLAARLELAPADPLVSARDRAFAAVRAEYDKRRNTGDFWDSIFGHKQGEARTWAEDQLRDISDRRVPEYSGRLNTFLSEQAKRRQAIESAKFGSQADFDKAVKEYTDWEDAQIAALEQTRAEIEGQFDAYKQFATDEVNAILPNIGKGFKQVLANPVGDFLGNVWKYTLGSGDENIPSLVTAPSRAINAVGNFLDSNRTIYRSDGTQGKAERGKNFWQATFGQRNFNIAPTKSVAFSEWMDTRRTTDSSGNSMTYRQWVNSLPASARQGQEAKLRRMYERERFNNDAANNAAEFFADPLFAASWLKAANIPQKLSKAEYVRRIIESRPVGAVRRFTDSVANSRPAQWLASDAKSPQQKFVDAQARAVAARQSAQAILPRVVALRKKIAGTDDSGLDYTVFDDLAKLSDHEAGLLQKMVGGKLQQAKWFQRGKFRDPAVRDKLEGIAARYKKFTDLMAEADDVTARADYFANTAWFYRNGKPNDLHKYDFRQQKKHPDFVQSSSQLYASQVDRFFRSDLENFMAANAGRDRTKWQDELQQLLTKYDRTIEDSRADVMAAYRKTRTLYGRVRGFTDRFGPSAIWKKAVLKYRPAWYVNNALYNTQAAVLAGGRRAVVEQARLLRPSNFRAAKAELAEGVAADVAPELGRGRLARFGGNLENWSRIAAFRAAKARGLSDEQALRRVNKYLFDYRTKNWERPLRAVMPFWGWQKNLVRAAAQMPLDRPLYAKAYNRVDTEQKNQFNRDFLTVVPRLKQLGYTDEEIAQFRRENEKYYAGRLKIGEQYIITPFNPFSEGGIGNLGVNPYLEALGEFATARDKFGRPLSGSSATFFERVAQKFPQYGLAKKGLARFDIAGGRLRPTSRWIGKPGSEGYGLTKEAQGFDPTAANYQTGLDPSAKLEDDIFAYLGKPRGLRFDTSTFLDRKTMQKLSQEYFATDWKSMDFPTQEAARDKLFKKYGVTPDRFYKGELAKYDSVDTKQIKKLKDEAFAKTRQLFDEYGRQPQGSRNVWATQKLRELVDRGYFATNPFLKSFDWTNPTTIGKAYKKIAYDRARTTGDWSAYNKTYGSAGRSRFTFAGKFFKTRESMQRYKDYHFWQRYFRVSDKAERRKLLRENPEYAKNGVKSESEVRRNMFWRQYMLADKQTRRKLLRQNPEYNDRKDWTDEQWDAWSDARRAETRRKLSGVRGFAESFARNRAANVAFSAPVFAKKQRSRTKKLVVYAR